MFLNGYPYTDFHELNADFLLKNYKGLLDALQDIDSWIENHEKEYNELKQYIEDLEAGRFTPEMIEALRQWTIKNTVDIIGSAIKMVFFTLSDDGYFVAHIPSSWKDITFKTTGYDIELDIQPEYGHLVLQY